MMLKLRAAAFGVVVADSFSGDSRHGFVRPLQLPDVIGPINPFPVLETTLINKAVVLGVV